MLFPLVKFKLRLSCKVHSPPSPSKIINDDNVLPNVWIVFPGSLDLKLRAPVYVIFINEFRIKEP